MKKSAEERSQEFTKLLEVNRSKASLTGLSTTFTSDPRYHAISAETRQQLISRVLEDASAEQDAATRAKLEARRQAVAQEHRRALSGVKRERINQDRDLRKLEDATYNIDRKSTLKKLALND
jgi:hypothetical protein